MLNTVTELRGRKIIITALRVFGFYKKKKKKWVRFLFYVNLIYILKKYDEGSQKHVPMVNLVKCRYLCSFNQNDTIMNY